MGVGIWSMHSFGMLAFSLPIALRYDLATALVSLLVAIITSGWALHVAGGSHLGRHRLAGGAVLMGGGIAFMHYRGMSAIRIVPSIDYDPLLVAASLAVAIAASYAALWLAFHLRSGGSSRLTLGRLGAALIMGLAISGMHYIGMAATRFRPGALCSGGVAIDNDWLAAIIGILAVALLAIVLITAVFDEHLQSRAATQAQDLREINKALEAEAIRSRTSEERLRQISDSLPAMISYWDSEGICRFANRTQVERVGRTPEEVIGMSVEVLYGTTLDARHRDRVEAALRGERQLFDQTEVGPGGDVTHWQGEFLPHRNRGLIIGLYALLVDITPLRAAKEAAESAANRQERIPGQHEPRDPHAAERRPGMARSRPRRSLRGPARVRVEVIRRSGEDLLSVLNDILDLSKIEAGKMDIEAVEVDAESLGRNVHATFNAAAAAKPDLGFASSVGPDRGRTAARRSGPDQPDPQQSRDNALKFTAEGKVTVTIDGVAPEGRDGLRLVVADTGIGITHEQRARLFSPFVQGDTSTTRRFGGTGLGLSICRRLVELMDGQIGVESTPGSGSCFLVRDQHRDCRRGRAAGAPRRRRRR